MMSADELLRECSMAFEMQFGEEFTGADKVKDPYNRSFRSGMYYLYQLITHFTANNHYKSLVQNAINHYADLEQQERERYEAERPTREEEKVF